MASLSLVFDLLGRDVSASKAFRNVGDEAGRAGKAGEGFGSSIGKGMKIAAGAIAAAGIGRAFAGFVTDAQESAKVSRMTEAVLKSTGGAAKITADQVSALATSISNKTAVDDEAVQSASNLLLTFTKVRNETGAGNDIFNQATQAAIDMSAAMGTDANGAALQLGKALNDPVKGMTALSKAGVSFTQQQKDQVKAMVASGDVLGAQKIILGEMQTQFGGAAAAAADPLERLKVIAGNLGEEVGGALLPHIERFSTFLTDRLIPGVKGLFDLLVRGDFTAGFAQAFGVAEDSGFVDFLFRVRETVVSVFGEITGGIKAFAAAWKYNDGEVTSSGFPGFMERLGFIARQVFDYVKNTVIPALIDFGGWIARNADIILPFIAALGAGYVVFQAITAITRAWAAAQAALNVVMAMNPIGLIIIAIAALVAGLVIAYQRSETFREIVDKAFRAVAEAGRWMWENILRPAFAALVAYWTTVAQGIQWAWTNLIQPAWTAIVAYAGFMWNNILKPYFGFILGVWTTVAQGVMWAWQNLISPAWSALVAYAGFLWNTILKPIFGLISAGWNLLGDGIRAVYSNVIAPVWGLFQRGIEGLQTVFQRVKDGIAAIWNGLVEVVKTPIRITFNFVNDRMVGPVNSILSKFPGNLSIPRLPQLASGGLLRGPGTGTSDSILGVDPRSGVPTAAVSNGEFVVRATQTKKHLGLLRAINEGVGQFAGGGLVERFGVKGHFLGDIVDGAGDLVGSAWDATKGAVSAVGNFAKDMVAKGARKAAELILKPIRDAAVGLIPNKVPMSLLSGGIDRLYNAVLGKGDEQDQAMAAVKKLAGPVTANGVGGLGPAAARAHAFVRSNWGFQGTIGGYANRNIAGTNVKSKHALGKAIDVMTLSNMGLGQSIADFFAGPGRGTFGVDNVIWNRRIHSGRGWGGYSGVSPHTDHPHIDFYKTGTSYVPHDGPAILHKGEAVIPADVNARGFGQPIVINIKGTFDLASSGDLRRAAVTMERELVKLQREKR